ncbi:hypothetical protein B0T09DRAFT_354387 [Sordaria sp. MPI-SDFR-AT-0083]|nr:hypothetical protein B0T09DRAFT_354387 [Sordaria sp. MPI-SDFR-AT-0083]
MANKAHGHLKVQMSRTHQYGAHDGPTAHVLASTRGYSSSYNKRSRQPLLPKEGKFEAIIRHRIGKSFHEPVQFFSNLPHGGSLISDSLVHHPLIQHYYLPPMPSLCGLKEAIEALERPETPNQVGSAIIKAVNVKVNSAADANRATNVNRTSTANIVVNFNQGQPPANGAHRTLLGLP